MKKLILASGSPRRKELLSLLGIPFLVIPAKSEELIISSLPNKVVEELSYQKALEVASLPQLQYTNAIILGSDTVVSKDNQIMGKPKDKTDAFHMLKSLQGSTHTVFTGVTFILTGENSRTITFSDSTKVSVYPMSDAEIEAYIATGEPMDKAGAYAIQGKFVTYISKIEGEYNTVVGLPIAHVYQVLKTLL